MTEETRQKALRALANAEVANENKATHFPMVFVCGKHVFFTFMAAWRQKKEYAFLGRNVEIEVMRTQYTTRVCHDMDQRGKVFSGESFPSKEYAQVIANN